MYILGGCTGENFADPVLCIVRGGTYTTSTQQEVSALSFKAYETENSISTVNTVIRNYRPISQEISRNAGFVVFGQ
jgi:hypothetical protein